MGLVITVYELDFIAAEKVGVKENRIMRIKDQLGVVNVDLIIVKDINDIHKCHRVDRGIEFVSDWNAAINQAIWETYS